jgi:hypothetical protein
VGGGGGGDCYGRSEVSGTKLGCLGRASPNSLDAWVQERGKDKRSRQRQLSCTCPSLLSSRPPAATIRGWVGGLE